MRIDGAVFLKSSGDISSFAESAMLMLESCVLTGSQIVRVEGGEGSDV